MRIFVIVLGLVAGLLGLFMSVCGGGFLLVMGHDTLGKLFSAHRDPSDINGLFVLLLPAGSLALGVVVVWCAYRMLRTQLKD